MEFDLLQMSVDVIYRCKEEEIEIRSNFLSNVNFTAFIHTMKDHCVELEQLYLCKRKGCDWYDHLGIEINDKNSIENSISMYSWSPAHCTKELKNNKTFLIFYWN